MGSKSGLDKNRLFLSIALAIAIWTILTGKLTLAIVLVFSLMVHEYGHYFWMDKEGIRKRDMIMIPPFGALAISKEPWPHYGAEARIGLAGPFFGLIPSVLFFVLYALTGNLMWAGAMALNSMINLFNLAPAAPLDGGRCFRAIIVSIDPNARIISNILAGMFIAMLIFNGFIFIAAIIGYIWYREESNFWTAKHILEKGMPKHEEDASLLAHVSSKYASDEKLMEFFLNRSKKAQMDAATAYSIARMRRMPKNEIIVAACAYVGVIMLHIITLHTALSFVDKLPTIYHIIRYF
jgi:Zn-dependent protease